MNEKEIAEAVGAFFGVKELAVRLLGPTADYLGSELKGVTQKGADNIRRVFIRAMEKLGQKLESPGQVAPRALKAILSEGYFADSEVATEYLGGILASSRSGDTRDDRGAYFASLIGRLSTYQIRSHYVLYHYFKHVFNGLHVPFHHMELREKASIFIPTTTYVDAMDCRRNEDMTPYVDHALVGLIKESLISDYYAESHSQYYRLHPPCGLETEDRIGIVAAPTRLGLELFMWTQGLGAYPPHQFFDTDNKFDLLPEVKLTFEGVEKTPVALHWGVESQPARI